MENGKCLLVTWHRLQRPGPQTLSIKSGLHPWKNITWCWLDGPFYTRSRAENASIKWPDRATSLNKPNRCRLYHFVRALEQRMPLPGYTHEKTPADVGWTTYTRSRAENASIKWPDRVTPLKKLQPMLVGPLYTCSRAENASIRVARLKKTAIDVVIFILYILYTYIYIYFISKCIYI